jgi:hypothetical protein
MSPASSSRQKDYYGAELCLWLSGAEWPVLEDAVVRGRCLLVVADRRPSIALHCRHRARQAQGKRCTYYEKGERSDARAEAKKGRGDEARKTRADGGKKTKRSID